LQEEIDLKITKRIFANSISTCLKGLSALLQSKFNLPFQFKLLLRPRLNQRRCFGETPIQLFKSYEKFTHS